MKRTALMLFLIVCLCSTMCSAAASSQIVGSVEIEFDFARMPTIASNQVAVWIEDQNGSHVKTLYVTDFTARRRGYEKRDMSLSSWVNAADPSQMTDDQLDVVSGATPASGRQRYIWDLTDSEGTPVPSGVYTIKIEGTLYWNSSVLYTAEVDLEAPDENIAVQSERSDPDQPENENMLQNVKITWTSDQ